jgi:mono/diheme cytochrome c family protein
MSKLSDLRLLVAAAIVFSVVQPLTAAPRIYDLPEETAVLAPGPGQKLAQASCTTCHSVDYISTQPPQRGVPFWSAEVTKMIKVYGAQIPDDDAKAIAAYLAAKY